MHFFFSDDLTSRAHLLSFDVFFFGIHVPSKDTLFYFQFDDFAYLIPGVGRSLATWLYSNPELTARFGGTVVLAHTDT